MRLTLLGLSIFYMMHVAYAETTFLEIISLQAQQENSDHVVGKEKIQTANTLGDALKHLSGVQSSAFGPHAGTPVIRSLSGHRVGVMENGLSIQGLNTMSGDIAIPFDSLFSQNITVNKWSDAVRHGGQAIGGSVDIDTGLIPKEIADKSHDMEAVLRKGFNQFDAKGMRIELNNQKNWATTLQFSQQEIDAYDIPGASKAAVCETQVFGDRGGVNTGLASQCQKDTRIEKIFNTRYQPYLNNYVLEHIQQNPSNFSDYYDSQESAKYTDKPVSTWYVNGRYVDYVNTPNPDYVAGESKEAIQKINQDVTPNYYKKLANSASTQDHYAIGTTYFMEQGYIGFSADHKSSQYGVPGFSLENKSFQSSYTELLPVSVHTKQNRFSLDVLWEQPANFVESIQVKAAKLNNSSGEYIAAKNANQYQFNTQQAELSIQQQPLKLLNNYTLSGEIGTIYFNRDITGTGYLKYLPNVKSETSAYFIQQKLDFNRFYLEAGYRTEQVQHKIQDQSFKLARNAQNTTLENRDFDLNSFSFGVGTRLTDYSELKAKYSAAERAPEINELYSSQPHYSVLAQEEGNQDLKVEKLKAKELTAIFSNSASRLHTTVYEMNFDNYLYLRNTGMSMRNRLPLKYWTQTDTTITGFEVDVAHTFSLQKYGDLSVSAFADLVKNKTQLNTDFNNEGQYFSNMPTNRYGASLTWDWLDWSTNVTSTYYDQPKYLGKDIFDEVVLPSYQMLDMSIKKKVALKNASFDFFLHGSNLLNEEARPQNSPLKYIAPLPGRGFQIGINLHL